MRITSITRRVALIALAIAASLGGAVKARAQIVLRPSQETALGGPGVFPDSSSRQRHVSRDTGPSMLRREAFDAPSAPATSNRDSEYEQIKAEAAALDRQFNLVRRVVKFVSPSIVHIEATKTTDPGKGFASSRVEEAGAGVVISLGGVPHVLTNRHVIHSADLNSIRMELNDGRQLRATNVWTDPSTDVAVIRLAERTLTPARLGDSDALEVGDFVLAVGSPFGLSHSVTYGILSAKGRRNLELGSREIQIQDFFQTDAAINPGNSGGPLLNLRGEVVGINTAIASNSGGNEGIGFTIPINMAILVAEQLVSRGQLERSYLGVHLDNAFSTEKARQLGLRSATGALVKQVIKGSPAQVAGLRNGDVIVKFDGVTVANDGHLVQTVGLTPIGRRVDIVFYRGGQASRVTAVLQRSPDSN
ncbi:MAG: trypsin-like peptidase domain-containing protein [Aureliella sp.]